MLQRTDEYDHPMLNKKRQIDRSMLGSIRQLEVLVLQLCAHLKDLLLRGRSVYPADLVPIDGEGPMVRRREVVKFTRFWIVADLFDLHG